MPIPMRTLLFWLALAHLGAVPQEPAIWLDVPFVRQEKEGCGAASVAMVMQYWIQEGFRAYAVDQVDPMKTYTALHSSREKGTLASEVERYLRERGFRIFVFRGQWENLREHLSKGRPLIVCLKAGDGDSRHYLVVAGLEGELVLVNDPARRKLTKLKRQRFEEEWKAAESWTLLAVPAEER
ncbi:MAG: C39 family peptidase [Acidobacteria bacterium]|nr:C39 family peptidase [Acidobacteriota bacterium]